MSSTNINLKQTAQILTLSSDEVMFLVQSGRLNNEVDTENMSWIFSLPEVLDMKTILDNEKQEKLEEEEKNRQELLCEND